MLINIRKEIGKRCLTAGKEIKKCMEDKMPPCTKIII